MASPSGPRAYTVAQICERLPMARSTFFELKRRGELPFLEELKPRAGRVVRYRADLVDRWTSGEWHQSRFFSSHRKAS